MNLSSLKDFGDWISPIIVKELRQGMRTKVFTAAFIVLQGFMVLFILMGWNSDRTSQSDEATSLFWWCVFITLILVMPLRGFGALSSEIRLDTMDLIALTQLSSWRITAGKWAALISQSILVSIAVMPYVVLRYFFGGVNLVAELVYLGGSLLMSCLLSAVMVGLSAFPNFLVRGVLAVASVIGGVVLIEQFIRSGVESSSGIPLSDIPGVGYLYLGLIGGALFLMYYFLDMGATRIAPEAVNYSTRKRLLSILFLGGVLSIPIFFKGTIAPQPFYLAGAILIGLFALDALTEKPSGVRSLHRRFSTSGPIGAFFQLLLTPGWFTGVFYVLIMGGMLFGMDTLTNATDFKDLEGLTIHLSFVGLLVFPLLVIHLFYPEQTEFFAAYFFIHCAAAAVGGALAIIDEAAGIRAIMWAGCPIPFVSYLMAWQDQYDNGLPLLLLAGTTLIIAVGVCIWRGVPQIQLWSQFRAEIREERRGPKEIGE
ncbi:MAG: hypothetical protein AAF585_01740 [Verrucomicrobiota bacterium]